MSVRNLVILAGLLGLALPAAAGDDDEGFFVGVEARALQPSGLPTEFVLVDPDDDGQPEGTVKSVDFSAEVSPRVFFGWSYDDGSAWTLSWWDYDEDDTDMASATLPGQLWDFLYHPDESFDDYEGTASAMAAVEATVIDLAYSRPAHKSDRFTMKWMAGLRQADLDYGLGVLYNDTFTIETVALTSEAEGIGLTGGISGVLKIADHWYVAGGAQLSFLTGEVETHTLMFDDVGGPSDPDANFTAEEDRAISIVDLHCSLVWNPSERWYIWLGYEFSQWANALDVRLLPDDVAEAFQQSDTSDVTWDGAKLGVGVRF